MKFKQLWPICVAIVAVAISPLAAKAQFTIGAGPSFTFGDFSDEAKTGWSGQMSYAFPVASLPFRIRTEVMYSDHRNVEREPSLWARVGGEWFRQLGFAVSAVRSLELGAVEPYGLLGLGLIREWHGDYSYSGTNHWNVRINAGVGLGLPIFGEDGLFVEVRPFLLGRELPLTRPATQPEVRFQSIPILIGIRL